VDALGGDEPIAHHLVELRHEGLDPIGVVDDLDHDRQVARQLEETRGPQVRRRAGPRYLARR
jgi:hypothetical protein